ncbi:MAG: hypothetical protein HGA45_28710 [Chloroflexales bacterium]|nr:hypothetical protein [Chloroflexales bacterium]
MQVVDLELIIARIPGGSARPARRAARPARPGRRPGEVERALAGLGPIPATLLDGRDGRPAATLAALAAALPAAPILERALAILIARLGPQHPDTGIVQQNLDALGEA